MGNCLTRAFLAALGLPPEVLRRMRLLVRPDTVLRWHRDIVARRHAARSRPKTGSRPRTARSIRALVLRRALKNPTWGYRHLHGELLILGVKVAASTVWEIPKEARIPPAPEEIADSLQTRCLRFVASEGERWKAPSPTALPFRP
ncbi:hypothetical protein ACFU99_16320 [Streptomyces sp. NPDC057654]|uniref:hypothetical protein n=1 Tax=Streptomyces sp. NPDC057654 TaxID=3346196 RepID=UPI0036797920